MLSVAGNHSYSQQHPPHEEIGHGLFSLCDAVEQYADPTNDGSSLHEYDDQYLGQPFDHVLTSLTYVTALPCSTGSSFRSAPRLGPSWGAGTYIDPFETIFDDSAYLSSSRQLVPHLQDQLLEQGYGRLQRDSAEVSHGCPSISQRSPGMFVVLANLF